MAAYENDSYEDYLERCEQVRGERKRLTPGEFERLGEEYRRLMARWDPDDIQLDEWKRADELKFLLVLHDDEDDDDFL